MANDPSRLAKKAARKSYTLPADDTSTHAISTSGPSAAEDSSDTPSTGGLNLTNIPMGGSVRPKLLATKCARKVAADYRSAPSRHSTADDDSDPSTSTRSVTLTDTSMPSNSRPLSIAMKASRKVAFRDPPPASQRPTVDSPSGHQGRMLASDESPMHRPKDRANATLGSADQRGGRSRVTRTANQGVRGLGYYRPTRSATTIDIRTVERRKWMSRRTSKEFIPEGGATRQRVSRIAAGRQSKPTPAKQQEHTARHHVRVSQRKTYLVDGKFVSLGPDVSLDPNDTTRTDESEESIEELPERLKAARKLQFGVKTSRPEVVVRCTTPQDEHENLRDDSEEETTSLYDTGDHSTVHGIMDDDDDVKEPTHSTRLRLPFLQRNVRRGFNLRSKMLGINPTDVPVNHTTARPAAVAVPIIKEDVKPKFIPLVETKLTPSVVEDFGPTARYPYLPESGDMYSCRPGGPRLYDILNRLPLEPFGVLSWVIVDREEELFELDDVLDEDKVMLALWYRWIFLNRNVFIASYFNGTRTFVTENWKLIRQAAGIAALRTWLLVLCVNNFLLPLEVVSLMQLYQSLVDSENASG